MNELRKRPSGRLFARVGFLICAWTLTATAGFGQTPFVPPTAPKDYKFLEVPGCQKQGQPVNLNLGTMAGTTPNIDDPDPHWLVTGPGISTPIAPYYTTLSAWTALPKAWVEPIKSFNNAANATAASGDYTYTIWFKLGCPPESYSNLQIAGSFAADNSATVYLNSTLVNSCSTGLCFASATAFTAPGPFVAGINSLSVVVHNDDSYTGMTIGAELRGSCIGDQCVRPSGLLKVCKVAGTGITVGTPFNFTISTSTSHAVLTVPAGPAPGGTCMIGPSYPVGTQVDVTEAPMPGVTVSSITVAPPGQVVNTNLPGQGVTILMGNGVTEVTYTDQRTGFLEICKKGDVRGSYTFTVNPGALGPFVVPAGACSPAIEVAAGSVTIHEQTAGVDIVACSTIPPAAQQPICNNAPPGSQNSVVTVVPGDISTMTIAFITNRPK
jgi:hypothetical protein